MLGGQDKEKGIMRFVHNKEFNHSVNPVGIELDRQEWMILLTALMVIKHTDSSCDTLSKQIRQGELVAEGILNHFGIFANDHA